MSYKRRPADIHCMSSLKVGNISYRTSKDDLRKAFENYGDIGDIYIPRDRITRKSRGFAFVRFYDKRDAEDAMDAMNMEMLDGRKLRVQMARPPDSSQGERQGYDFGGDCAGCDADRIGSRPSSHRQDNVSSDMLAEQKKEEGNEYYQKKLYQQALSCYSDAITLCPRRAIYYGNRAATYIMLNNYKDALKDARQSIILDDKFAKGYFREGKCHMALGDVSSAMRCYRKVLDFEGGHEIVIEDIKSANAVKQYENIAETDFRKGDFKRALFYIDRCIEKCPACNRLKMKRAEILLKLDMYEDADEVAKMGNQMLQIVRSAVIGFQGQHVIHLTSHLDQTRKSDILRRDNLNADAFYVKGLCLYYTDNFDKAYQYFQRVLQLAPYHVNAKTMFKRAKALTKKEEGNDEFRSGHFQEAYDLYSEALAIDPYSNSIKSILYCNRATCSSKLGKTQKCIDDCTKAIEFDDSYVKAYLMRAKCYMKTEMYEEAISDYKRVNKLDKSLENEKLLQEAIIMLEKSKAKDYYSILGVPKTASINEIKKHYKKKAKVHHPDRHRHDTTEKQKAEEIIFKQISQAYSVLSDPKKKENYDRGW